METNERQYKLSFSELIDKLTITQLRELQVERSRDFCSKEIEELTHDIDLIIKEDQIQIDARSLRIIFLIAQLNTLIWTYKDIMGLIPADYDKYLKLSHQVNGLKNQLKNKLSETGRTNINTDGLNFFVSL